MEGKFSSAQEITRKFLEEEADKSKNHFYAPSKLLFCVKIGDSKCHSKQSVTKSICLACSGR